MQFMPITLIAVLTSSLAMALVFVPVLGSFIGKASFANDPESMKKLTIAEEGDLNELTGVSKAYVAVLSFVLKAPGMVIIAAIALLIGLQWFYKEHGNGVQFFPEKSVMVVVNKPKT